MKSPRFLPLVIALFMAAGLTPARAIGELFIKVDNILGESRFDGHVGEIDVLSFSFGASQTGIREAGGRASARRSSLSPIVIVKNVDKASPKFFLACATGTHIKDAVITVRKAGDKPLEYLTITLSDVLISSYSVGAADSGGVATESISFSYSKIEYKYIPQNDAGQPLPPVVVSFDLIKNKELALQQ